MPITLTCTCGQLQYVANEMAGQTSPCVACGKLLTVPALGKIVPTKARSRPAKIQREKAESHLGQVLLIAGVATLLLGAAGFLLWAIQRRLHDESTQIAQLQEIEPNETPSNLPTTAPRKQPEPERKETPAVQPTPPETRDPPRPVLEPIKPKTDAPKPVVEEVKPTIDPPPIVAKKPVNVIEALKLVWKLKGDDTFFQELIVTQAPTFKVPGIPIPIASMLKYRIVSRFTVKKVDEDGALVVEQKIESAKLLHADDLTKPTVVGALERMPGTTYKIELSPKMDVTKFEGAAAALQVMPRGGGLGMQMTSLLDRDGWKELAQATFFQMDRAPKVNTRWSKPLTHNWGSLGSWSGQIHYLYMGEEVKLHKIAYGLQLGYKAPVGGAVGLMKITGANFRPQQAEGVIFFDRARGRVSHAEERFRVQGVINANLLGQNTVIEIDEDQHFLIRIHDQLPVAK